MLEFVGTPTVIPVGIVGEFQAIPELRVVMGEFEGMFEAMPEFLWDYMLGVEGYYLSFSSSLESPNPSISALQIS